MSSMAREITGDALVHHLPADAMTIDLALVVRHGRSARTLVKQGPLRLTLMELAKGASLPTHSAEGPISIHVLRGRVLFTAAERSYPLAPGDVLVLAAGVEHAAQSESGALFLLSVVHQDS